MQETTKILGRIAIFMIVITGIPLLLYSDYIEARDLVDNGRDGVLVVNTHTATLSKGNKLYEASIDGQAVLLRTDAHLTPGETYQIIYSPARLADYASDRKGAFYGYMFGSKSQGVWHIFRQEVGDILLVAALCFVGLFIVGILISVRDYYRAIGKGKIAPSSHDSSTGKEEGEDQNDKAISDFVDMAGNEMVKRGTMTRGKAERFITLDMLHELASLPERDVHIVGEYGRVLTETPGPMRPISKLPFPKETIRTAIETLLAQSRDPEYRNHLKTVLFALGDFVPDEEVPVDKEENSRKWMMRRFGVERPRGTRQEASRRKDPPDNPPAMKIESPRPQQMNRIDPLSPEERRWAEANQVVLMQAFLDMKKQGLNHEQIKKELAALLARLQEGSRSYHALRAQGLSHEEAKLALERQQQENEM